MSNSATAEDIARAFVTAMALVATSDGKLNDKELNELSGIYGVMNAVKGFDKSTLIELTKATAEEINSNVNEDNINGYIKENIANFFPSDSFTKQCLIQAMFWLIRVDGTASEKADDSENKMAIRIIRNLGITDEELFIEGLTNCERHQKKRVNQESQNKVYKPEDIAKGLAYAWGLVLGSEEVKIEGLKMLTICLNSTKYTKEYDATSLAKISREAIELSNQKGIDYVIDKIKELIPEEAHLALLPGIIKILDTDKKASLVKIEVASKILDAVNVSSSILLLAQYYKEYLES